MAGNKHWNQKERKLLEEHYSHIAAARLKDAFPNRSVRSITGQAQRLGLKKSHERLSEMGREISEKRGAR